MSGSNRRAVQSGAIRFTAMAVAVVATGIAPASPVVASNPPSGPIEFVVDSAGDGGDGALGDGRCKAANGSCTLRAALDEGRKQMVFGGRDVVVTFSPTLHDAVVAIGGDLDVEIPAGRTLTVTGPADPGLRPLLDGGLDDRLIELTGGGSAVISGLVFRNAVAPGGEGGGVIRSTLATLQLDHVTVTGGATRGGAAGGGVWSAGSLTLVDSEISGNGAEGKGGGVASTGPVSVTRSVIVANATGSDGGGVWAGSTAVTIIDSLIADNVAAGDGGGVLCDCSSFSIERSSILGNDAELGAGGGVFAGSSDGDTSVDARNVSVAGNVSDGDGGGIKVGDGGQTSFVNVTISGNDSRTGGAALSLGASAAHQIANSILYGNTASVGPGPAEDCGSLAEAPISYTTGASDSIIGTGDCTLVDEDPDDGFTPRQLSVDPVLGPADAYGGTPIGPDGGSLTVVPILGGSPALGAGTCALTEDARGVPRTGPACDLGAFELTLSVGAILDDADGTIGPASAIVQRGTSRIRIDQIPASALSVPFENEDPSRANPATNAQIRGIDLGQTGFAATPLRQVALDALPLDDEVLGSISLDQLPLDYQGSAGTGWLGYLLDLGLDELAGQPLNTVTLGQVLTATAGLGPAAELDLVQIDFSATPLGSLPVGAIALGSTPLTELELPPGSDWCTIIGAYSAQTCGPDAASSIDLSRATLVSISLQGVPLRQVPLRQVPLRQVDLSAAPLRQVPLRQVDLAASPLRQVPLRQVDLAASPLRQVPLRQVDILASPLRQVPLRQVLIQSAPLRQVPLRQVNLVTSPLRQVPLRQVANLPTIVDCSAFSGCGSQTLTLGDVPVGALIGTLGALAAAVPADLELGTLGEIGDPTDTTAYPDAYGAADAPALATLLDLVGLFGDTTLGDIGGRGHPDAYGEAIIDDFLALLLELFPDTTLGELLAGVLPQEQQPWQDIDVEGAATELKVAAGEDGQADVSYEVPIESTLPAGTEVAVELSVPDGYTLLPASFQLNATDPAADAVATPLAVLDPVITPDDRPGRTLATMTIVPPVGASRLVFRAVAPLQIGDTSSFELELIAPPFWNLSARSDQGVDQITIADLLENNDDVDVATPFLSPQPAPDETADKVLFLTHVANAADVDWFDLDVAQGEQLSVYLSNLPADYDVLLYGPAKAPLRGAPSKTLPPSPDGGVSLLGADNAVNAIVNADIPTAAPGPEWQLYGLSSRRGRSSELIDTGALTAGRYAIKVVGYNGATSASPYTLRARLTPTEGPGDCPAQLPAGPTTVSLPSAVTTVTDQTTTILLTHLGRLERSYGAGAAQVGAALTDFVTTVNAAPADHADTSAAVVTLDDLPAYGAWDASRCDTDAANAVVSQIGALIDATRAEHPNVTNVVLVGGDDQIPFARVQDAVPAHNESEYAETFDGSSALKAALSQGYVLTDNAYGSANPVGIGPRELFVPELSVGRLVESPADIVTALDNFTAFNGTLDPRTALSTGYDFLSDGAEAVSDELRAPNGRFATVNPLISGGWTRIDLRDAWLGTGPSDAADVASVNAHFDHYRALPADQDASGRLTDPFTLDDVTSSPDGSLAGSIVFSMGCHMGLSVSDVSVGGGLDDDWAQTLSGEGAIVAGNSGYGYGDDSVVGATEELMRLFAGRLDGSTTVGQSMTFAKQQYTADLLVVSPFDEKVVSQVVFYGLPMYRLAEGVTTPPAANPPTTVDPVTGLDSLLTTINLPIGSSDGLNEVDTADGRYYEVDREIQSTPYQPVQPRTTIDVTQPGRTARGALITLLRSTDVALPDPVIMTPTDDVTGSNPEARVDGAFFPSRLQAVARREDVSGPRDQLVIVPGQFRDLADSVNGAGVQRLFTETSAVVFYAPEGNTDVTPPTITATSAAIVGSAASFSVQASDDVAVSRVNVLFTSAADGGAWHSQDLSFDGVTYTAAAPVAEGTTEVDYFVQVVDSGGNVSVSSDKGTNFTGTAELSPQPGSTAPVILLPPTDVAGRYAGAVEVRIAPGTAGGPVNSRLDGGPTTTSDSIFVDGSGVHTVESIGPDGATTTVTFYIVAIVTPPTASAATTAPVPASGWFTTPVTVDVTGTAGSSPVRSVQYRLGSSAPFTATAGTTASVAVSAEGVSTVEFLATDSAGLESPLGALEVRIDSVAPDVAVTSPVAGAIYTVGQVVNAAYTCTDASSGLAPTDGCSGPPLGQPIDTSAAGAKTFAVSATDVAGNVGQASVPYTVVAAAPSFVPVPGGSFSVRPDGGLDFGPSTSPLGSFAWLAGPGGRNGTVTGPLTFTTTGTSSARGFGATVGALQRDGVMYTGYTAQFDPGYDCGTRSNGGRVGAFVIQGWIGGPITGLPFACTPAPVDLYPGANNAERTAAAKADRNARFWSQPMTIAVTVRPGAIARTTQIIATATSPGPNGELRTITVSTTVFTATLGPSWGLRAFGNVTGTVMPAATID